MTPAELVERVARAIAKTQDDDWDNPVLFLADANDTAESGREAYRDMALAAVAIALEEAASICAALRRKGVNNDIEYREACTDAETAIRALIRPPVINTSESSQVDNPEG